MTKPTTHALPKALHPLRAAPALDEKKSPSSKFQTVFRQGKHHFTKAHTAFLTLTLSTLFLVDRVFGSSSLTEVETASNKVNALVTGPIGKSALVGATVYGAWNVFQKGSVIGAMALVLIGAGVSLEIGEIMKVFK